MSEILFIGTGDAFGAGGRRQSAFLLRAPGGGVLVDCGMTTGTGLCALGVESAEIETILISHFHGDHFGGIPVLLLGALYEERRSAPLRIAGPPDIERRVRDLAAAIGYAIEDHQWSFPILFQELPTGSEVEVGPVRVRSFATRHQAHTAPHGLVIDAGPERIAYSGDTGWFEELPSQVGESDLFICECTYCSHDFQFHLNLDTLVEQRECFACGRMILTHLGSEMTHLRNQVDFETADDGLSIKI
jgi:ribonuclease BN (tRNA processing enzyme)